MRKVVIDERFIAEQERVAARIIRRECDKEGFDLARVDRRAYAETLERALARGGRI